MTVTVSYQFQFLPLIGAAAKALGGLNLTSTQTERAEAVPAGYATGNVNFSSCP